MRPVLPLTGVALLAFGCDTFDAAPVADAGPDGRADAPSGCATLYVNQEAGLDTNTGCAPSLAKRTLTSALAAARERKAEVAEIHVCKGDYREPNLTLDVRVTLRGGYACGNFTREATFGAAATWKYENATALYNTQSEAGGAGLRVVGTDIGNSVEIDGLAIHSAAKAAEASYAINVENASPFIHDCALYGDGGDAGGAYALGLSGSSARVVKNYLNATGGGRKQALGGAGVFAIGGGTVVVEQNDIEAKGGRGTNAGSVGMFVSGVGLLATGNRIAVHGAALGPAGYGQSVGILLLGAGTNLKSKIIGNRVSATGEGAMETTTVAGISTENTRDVELRDNRIYVGALAGDATAKLSFSGLQVQTSAGALVASNVIVNDATLSSLRDASRVGIGLEGSPNSALVGNTIVFARAQRSLPGWSEASVGVQLSGGALRADPQSIEITFHRNAIVMQGEDLQPSSRSEYGLLTTSCGNTFAEPPQSNVILGLSTPIAGNPPLRARFVATENCALNSPRTAADTLPGDAAATNNPRYACPSPTPAQCVDALFQDLNKGDVAASLFRDGLKWGPSASCGLVTSGGGVAPAHTTDLLGKPRTVPFTPGAYEDDRTCP